jgi:hypothetical protein
MTKRQILLEHIKIAGYNGDYKKAMQLYCENRISRESFDTAFNLGIRIKENEIKALHN